MQKTVLITGWAGYIGAHTVVAFEKAGYKTVIIDNLSRSTRHNLQGIAKILGHEVDFYQCDIADKMTLDGIFQSYSIDGVLHFAGYKSVGESVENPLLYYANNISGSIAFFEVMQKYSIQKLIFSSSATVYDTTFPAPFREDSPLVTTNPYGMTKLVLEKILKDLSVFSGWSVTSLRYFNPIGAHSSGYIGEFSHEKPNNLLPFLYQVILWKYEKLGIFGDDYPTSDGTPVRDYIDVNDLVDAHLLAYEALETGFNVFNVGTGVGTSVRQMLDACMEALSIDIPHEVQGRRFGDVALTVADISKISENLWFSPKIPLAKSITSGWKSIQNAKKIWLL